MWWLCTVSVSLQSLFQYGSRLELATKEICGMCHERQPFLGSEECCMAGTAGGCTHCHRSAVGKEQLLAPLNLFHFWESQAGGEYSFVVKDADLSHKWAKSLGLEAVSDEVTFLFFPAGSDLSFLPLLHDCWCSSSAPDLDAVDIQDCIGANASIVNSLMSVTQIGTSHLIEP